MDPKIFGRYQIVRKLAGGGMGRVFLAFDPTLNRHVGLKLIDSGADRESMDVVAAERRGSILQDQLAKRESGGRVAQIFDVGERDGYFYIAMEYIEGDDLSELVDRGPLDPHRAVEIALDILDVLVKAHNFQTVIDGRPHRGIIHGDIKPRNIRITPSGQVKVLDFGIAKAVSMTRSITFNQYGSVPYSSPERLQTGDMDARSDVWAVATVLFEMLTGHPYFSSEQSSKLEWMIRNYRTLQPSLGSIPAGLCEIISRALDPIPGRRFSSAAAFEAALHAWKNPESARATTRAEDFTDADATRRTFYSASGSKSQSTRPLPTQLLRSVVTGKLPKPVLRAAIAASVALFLGAVFTVVYEIRMWNNAESLSREIDSGRLSVEGSRNAYTTLAKNSLFSFPLYPARSSLRNRFTAEADRVIADYREASESTPVYLRDWRRAQAALTSAIALSPEDKSIRGKYRLIDGHIQWRGGNVKGARSDFEAARDLLAHSPDPHLGLALIEMSQGELDRAENELNEAKRNGFLPGRREQKFLADGYRSRGERWLEGARGAQDLAHMEDALRRADGDLAHAQDLYNSVAPFYNGVKLAERVSTERERAAKSLEQAQQIHAQPVGAQTPVAETR